ncbi:helix-turn-helix domain-containing protein [Cribrihabitans pelagius]|uniref:helix-turn-helix domain-containing protein n=1 Tax=Cribrihabitans pelagius TaxID=1765746 RepID=UPI003B59C9C4
MFRTLMEERNLGRAAERVCITQLARANALKRLRTLLRDPLFIRERYGMRPTPLAEQLAPRHLRSAGYPGGGSGGAAAIRPGGGPAPVHHCPPQLCRVCAGARAVCAGVGEGGRERRWAGPRTAACARPLRVFLRRRKKRITLRRLLRKKTARSKGARSGGGWAAAAGRATWSPASSHKGRGISRCQQRRVSVPLVAPPAAGPVCAACQEA